MTFGQFVAIFGVKGAYLTDEQASRVASLINVAPNEGQQGFQSLYLQE